VTAVLYKSNRRPSLKPACSDLQ